jgi:hypothetical protein
MEEQPTEFQKRCSAVLDRHRKLKSCKFCGSTSLIKLECSRTLYEWDGKGEDLKKTIDKKAFMCTNGDCRLPTCIGDTCPSAKEQHVCDAFCDCKTLASRNCSTCKDTDCTRQGDKNFVCGGWTNDLREKRSQMIWEELEKEECKKEEQKKEEQKTCEGCRHGYAMVSLPVCQECSRYPQKPTKDNWEPLLPEKHENLTWGEADKLWHEGWNVMQVRNGAAIFNWDSFSWSYEQIRATDWYVVGRR